MWVRVGRTLFYDDQHPRKTTVHGKKNKDDETTLGAANSSGYIILDVAMFIVIGKNYVLSSKLCEMCDCLYLSFIILARQLMNRLWDEIGGMQNYYHQKYEINIQDPT